MSGLDGRRLDADILTTQHTMSAVSFGRSVNKFLRSNAMELIPLLGASGTYFIEAVVSFLYEHNNQA